MMLPPPASNSTAGPTRETLQMDNQALCQALARVRLSKRHRDEACRNSAYRPRSP
jgi:hypothetical protein